MNSKKFSKWVAGLHYATWRGKADKFSQDTSAMLPFGSQDGLTLMIKNWLSAQTLQTRLTKTPESLWWWAGILQNRWTQTLWITMEIIL